MNIYSVKEKQRQSNLSLNFSNFNDSNVDTSGIVFIDSMVDDYEMLMAGVKPGLEVVLLDDSQDGITQITQCLKGRSGLSSLHIVTHGDAGELWVGIGFVNSHTLEQYKHDFQSWAAALAPDADILLYGCNIAAGETGRQFVQLFSELTGADVAASSNLTGSAALGGDWELEVKIGNVEAPIAFGIETMEAYGAVLVTFSPATNFSVGGFPYSPESIAVGDFNRDGFLDLVMDSGVSGVSILLGTGTGSFGAPTSFGVGRYPASVAVGDFNADNNLDIATANIGTNNVSILLGTGTGSFGGASNFGVDGNARSVAVADFNRDGFLDIATANYTLNNNVSILLGTGTGSFATATNFGVGSMPISVAVGDFNKDGNPDLASANNGSGSNVSILLGTGTGSFATATNFGVGSSPTAVAVGDFNKDGNDDLATSNGSSNNVSILLGTGTGSFGAPTNFIVGSSANSIVVGDFNVDGFLDLATTNYASNNISLLLGTGTGSFGAATNFDVGKNPFSLAVGDFNADGRLDLATVNGGSTANGGSDYVSILLNTTSGTENPWTGTPENDTYTYTGTANFTGNGLAGNDTIVGGIGNDTLIGGTGNDSLVGGLGNDTYYVDSSRGDKIVENLNEGIDTVISSQQYQLGNNLENLSLTGTAIRGTGNSLDNRIIGNSQANSLVGRAGNDTIFGGAGNDNLNGNDGDDRLSGGEGNDTLLGERGSDFLLGGNGNDVLVGYGNTPGEVDTLIGGSGSDTFGVGVSYARFGAGSGSGGLLGYTGDGNTGFALIRGWESTDFIELKGDISQYTFGSENRAGMNTLDTTIYYNGVNGPDLIAVVQDATNVPLGNLVFF
jgi:Ca2+-binding RTX toxin-like protein